LKTTCPDYRRETYIQPNPTVYAMGITYDRQLMDIYALQKTVRSAKQCPSAIPKLANTD